MRLPSASESREEGRALIPALNGHTRGNQAHSWPPRAGPPLSFPMLHELPAAYTSQCIYVSLSCFCNQYHGPLPPRHCGRVPQNPEATTDPCFQVPGIAQCQTMKTVPCASTVRYGEWQNGCSSNAWLQRGRVVVTLSPHTGFKVCKKCGFFLWLGLPSHSLQVCLAYLVLCFRIPVPPWSQDWSVSPFLHCFSVTFLLLHAFHQSCHLFS
jgi:hypothetical protein